MMLQIIFFLCYLYFVHMKDLMEQNIPKILWCVPNKCEIMEEYGQIVYNKTAKYKKHRRHLQVLRRYILSESYHNNTLCGTNLNILDLTMSREDFKASMYKIYSSMRKLCKFEENLITLSLKGRYYYSRKKKNNQKVKKRIAWFNAPFWGSYNLLKAVLLKHDSNKRLLVQNRNDTTKKSYWLQFGVNEAYSVNITSIIINDILKLPDVKIHGFDEFIGLPESWGGLRAGYFSQSGILPFTEKGIELHKGWFNESLSTFLDKHPCNSKTGDTILIGANIDNDLYEGARYILKMLAPCMRKGTLLHFHELFHPKIRYMDEMKALYDFMTKDSSDMIIQLLPYKSNSGEAAVFKVVRPPIIKVQTEL